MSGPPLIAIFWGEDDFLLRQAAQELIREHGLRATEIEASGWQGGESSDLATPSLWGERRALLVTGTQSLTEAGTRELASYFLAPSPDAVCVLTQISRGKNPPPIAKSVQAARGLVKQVVLKRQDLQKWVGDRARSREVRLSTSAAGVLIGTVGEDPATLDQSIEQLATAFPGQQVGPEQVRAQFQGLGEQRVWDLCDQAFSGRLPQALVVLRSLLDGRDDPLLILGGMAARLRDLLRVRALPDRIPTADAVRAAGLRFDWQLRRYREQARRYAPEELVRIHELMVDADRALKGGAAGDVVLTTLVAATAGETSAALSLPVRIWR